MLRVFFAGVSRSFKRSRPRRRGSAFGAGTFGIFDAFPDEAGRNAHLSGRVAAALMEKASDLLAQPPTIEKIDVLAAKLPS
jgi:quinol monooxygenase YgiN